MKGCRIVVEGYGAIKSGLRRIEGCETIAKNAGRYKGMEAVMEGSGAIGKDLER